MFIVHIEFLNHGDMTSFYWRNNRNDGAKNLQCFPQCNHRHDGRQFCGKSLHVLITFRISASEYNQEGLDWNDFVIIGQFTSTKPPQSSPNILSYRNYLRNKKSLQNLLGEYYEGMTCLSAHVPRIQQWIPVHDGNYFETTQCFEFNRELLGWHYGWVSNKHRANDLHCFLVSIYQHGISSPSSSSSSSSSSGDVADQEENHTLFLIGQGESPSFIVKSARRKSKQNENQECSVEETIHQQFTSSGQPRPSPAPPTPSAPPSAPYPAPLQPTPVPNGDPIAGLTHEFQKVVTLPKSSEPLPIPPSSPPRCVTPPPTIPSPTVADLSPTSHQTSLYSSAIAHSRKKSRSNRTRAVLVMPMSTRYEIDEAVNQIAKYQVHKEMKKLERHSKLESLKLKFHVEISYQTFSATSQPCSSSFISSSFSSPAPPPRPLSSCSSGAIEDKAKPMPSSKPRPRRPRMRRSDSGEWSHLLKSLSSSSSFTSLSFHPSIQQKLHSSNQDFEEVFGLGGLNE